MDTVKQQRKKMFGVKKEKGRHRLCIGTPPHDFRPSSPEDFPCRLDAMEVALLRCTMEQGILAARRHNAGQLQVAPADRRWAVVIHGTSQRKHQHQDQGQNQRCGCTRKPRAEFTDDEIGRLLTACQNARLPDVANISPAAWWRGLIMAILSTGLRLDDVLALRRNAAILRDLGDKTFLTINIGPETAVTLTPEARATIEAMGRGNGPMLFPWPHSRQELHAAFRELLQAAGIDPGSHSSIHGLRRAGAIRQWQQLQQLQQSQKRQEGNAT
jgi:hypothetical protein